MSEAMKSHWNKVYSSKPLTQLGWYEPQPEPSLHWIERCGLDKGNIILDVGSGATTLIKALLEQGYRRLYALDISEAALGKARAELGLAKASLVQWIVDDITNPSNLPALPQVALWHDRAVLHFFTDEPRRQGYLSTLRNLLRPGGYAIIAAFAIGGANKCSGLDVRNYDKESLSEFLGSDFELIQCMDYIYKMPSGDLRPYVYTLYQRSDSKNN